MIPILAPVPQIWYCPKCSEAARTIDAKTPMHRCVGFAGLQIPLVRQGDRVEHVAEERQDYIGDELVAYDANGRPIMGVTTKRETGEDRTVYAPTATAKMKD